MCLFFCNDTATPEIYTYLHTLSLRDALPISGTPICRSCHICGRGRGSQTVMATSGAWAARRPHNRVAGRGRERGSRSEEHTSELQSLMRISYAVFCLKKKKTKENTRKLKTQHLNPNYTSLLKQNIKIT